MKYLTLILALLVSTQGAQAQECKEPITFKVKYRVKQTVLFVPRFIKLIPGHWKTPVSTANVAWNLEAINIRSRGQCWTDFTFFSWGD